jgi:hypothetical protein
MNVCFYRLAVYIVVFNLEDLAPNAPAEQQAEALEFIQFWYCIRIHFIPPSCSCQSANPHHKDVF